MTLTVDSLVKNYNKKSQALKGVSMNIEGGVYGLIGRNGAGKTTLMRILATVMHPTSGGVTADGTDVFKILPDYRGKLGYLPQNTQLMPSMNIVEFLDYVCVLKGIKDKAKRKEEIERCIEIVGLEGEEKKRLAKYSGGMLRRAGIAQSLLGSPQLLIIDEPTTGLDPEERLYFINLLSKISGSQTILLSTHIIHDIESICRNVCVLERGEVKYEGSTEKLIERVAGRVWHYEGTPGEEQGLKDKTTVVSVNYMAGKPVIRYVSDESVKDGSENVTATLEDAYIESLGGVKR